ncbi:MAG: hypothetical protein LBD41_07935 [Clostridiales Family XIII bacterium]|jgi:hypothetical protein|nr:hypothetical protein [Clostridiales Family XIII bacterium]
MLKILGINELTFEEIKKTKDYLKVNTITGKIEGIFWLIIPDNILTNEQITLLNTKGPFKIAIEVGKNNIIFEILVRSESLDNSGGGLPTKEQYNFILNFYNKLVNYIEEKEGVK